jgi:hypothetical protein
MRPLVFLISIAAVTHCLADTSRTAGPLPYLFFDFHMTGLTEGRMLSAENRQFTYTARPRNFWLGHDTVTMQAKLLKKTPKGFRFSWSMAHSRHDRGRPVTQTIVLPWSKDP